MLFKANRKNVVVHAILIVVATVFIYSTAHAQTGEQGKGKTVEKVTTTFKNVENMVSGLAQSVDSMSQALKEGKVLAEKVGKDFEETVVKFQNAAKQLEDDSEIMKDMDENIGLMEEYREFSSKKMRESKDKNKQQWWLSDKEYWQDSSKKAKQLKDQIIAGRNLLNEQIDQLNQNKDMIMALMRREHNEKTLAAMKLVANDLDAINNELNNLLKEVQKDFGGVSN